MKLTKRVYAKTIDLKLNQLKHLRRSSGTELCLFCHFPVKEPFYFVELGWKELAKPIQTDNFVITRVQVPLARYCIPCSRKAFPTLYKKICRNGLLSEGKS